jgi:paraquat-inducible protein B
MKNAALQKFRRYSVVFGGIFILGCQTTDMAVQQAGLNAEEEKQFRKAQTKTRAGGTALGALVGGGLGYAVGGDWKGAAIGAAAGGIAGLAAGEKKAQTQARIMVSERQLDNLIARTEKTNNQLRAQIAQLSRQRQSFKTRITKAKSTGNKSELRQVKKEMSTTLSSSDTMLSSAKQQVTYNNSVSSKSPAKQSLLRSETQKLDSATRELQQERDLFASLYNSIDV